MVHPSRVAPRADERDSSARRQALAFVAAAILTTLASCGDSSASYIEDLGDPRPWISEPATRELVSRGEDSVPRLIELCVDSRAKKREAAVDILGRIALEPTRVLPILTRTIRDPVEQVRRASAQAIGRFGPAAGSCVDVLGAIAADANERFSVRYEAILSLGRIGRLGAGQLSSLILVLEDPIYAIAASWTIEQWGVYASSARNALESAVVRARSAEIRTAYRSALAAITAPAIAPAATAK